MRHVYDDRADMTYRDTDPACPACGKDLAAIVAAGRRLRRCDACQGIWVEHEVLASMFADMSAGAVTRAPLEPLSIHAPPSAKRSCAFCHATLLERMIGEIRVDVCDTHGIWFDHEELERAIRHRPPTPEEVAARLRRPVGNALDSLIDYLGREKKRWPW